MTTSPVSALVLPATVMQTQAQAVADDLVRQLLARVSAGTDAVLDASALTHFDSSALAVVLACRRAVQAQGATLHLRGLPERVQALAHVYGLADLLR